MGVGRGGRGGLVPSGFWNSKQKKVVLSISRSKKQISSLLAPPGKTFGKIPFWPPPEKILPTPMVTTLTTAIATKLGEIQWTVVLHRLLISASDFLQRMFLYELCMCFRTSTSRLCTCTKITRRHRSRTTSLLSSWPLQIRHASFSGSSCPDLF